MPILFIDFSVTIIFTPIIVFHPYLVMPCNYLVRITNNNLYMYIQINYIPIHCFNSTSSAILPAQNNIVVDIKEFIR